MKRFILIFLSIIIIFNFYGCNNKYKDGSFTGIGNKYLDGSDDCTLTISEGKIKDVTLRHFNSTGKEVNYNDVVDSSKKITLKQYRSDFMKEILNKQSADITLNYNIPKITDSWKLATQNALNKAKK